jgi:hypothetical protein
VSSELEALEWRLIVEHFLSFVLEIDGAEPAAESKLEFLLGQLALGRHDGSFEGDATAYPDPPEQSYKELYAIIGERFPTLGLYNMPGPKNEFGVSEGGVGDAVDDLTDIVKDLVDVAWRFENTSVADAMWHFAWGYRNHWGEHLRDLQRFLYSLREDD